MPRSDFQADPAPVHPCHRQPAQRDERLHQQRRRGPRPGKRCDPAIEHVRPQPAPDTRDHPGDPPHAGQCPQILVGRQPWLQQPSLRQPSHRAHQQRHRALAQHRSGLQTDQRRGERAWRGQQGLRIMAVTGGHLVLAQQWHQQRAINATGRIEQGIKRATVGQQHRTTAQHASSNSHCAGGRDQIAAMPASAKQMPMRCPHGRWYGRSGHHHARTCSHGPRPGMRNARASTVPLSSPRLATRSTCGTTPSVTDTPTITRNNGNPRPAGVQSCPSECSRAPTHSSNCRGY